MNPLAKATRVCPRCRNRSLVWVMSHLLWVCFAPVSYCEYVRYDDE